MQRPTPKTQRNGLHLVRPNEVDENLAVERATRHAAGHALSWKQYVQDLDFFLGMELEFENVIGLTWPPENR